MSEDLYTDGFPHTPFPEGPHFVSAADLCTSGEDSSLIRLFYPTPAGNKKSRVMDPQKWANWYLGDEYNAGFVQFITSSANYSRYILPALKPLLYMYGYCLIKNMKVPVEWCQDLLPRDTKTSSGGQEGWPVVVTSHGMATHRSALSTFASDLASHGFVVASVEHREGSASASFHVDPKTREKIWMKYTAYRPQEQLDSRASDIYKAVSVLKRLNEGDVRNLLDEDSPFPVDTFRNRLDLSNLVIMGHSYGGSTVIKALADPRNSFRCAVILDPWMYPIRTTVEELGQCIRTPLLSISTEQFNKGPNRKVLEVFQDALPSSKTSSSIFHTMKGTCHHHGNDSPWVSGKIGWWVTAGTYDHHARTIYKLQRNMIFSFIDTHIDTSRDEMYSSPEWLPDYEKFVNENAHILITHEHHNGV